MTRKIFPLKSKATCWAIPMNDFAKDPIAWLSDWMKNHQLQYLLAHADDGVIWGHFTNQGLTTSNEVIPKYSPSLRIETLQMVRIFSSAGEMFVWRNEDGQWLGRIITEDTNFKAAVEQLSESSTDTAQFGLVDEWTEAFEEQQMLLGTSAKEVGKGFYLLTEGLQGMHHAVPLDPGEINDQLRPLRLKVCHYVKEDEYGFLRVNASRLVTLKKESNV